uniref:Uncharacterized protein n=1 Tax=Candidatus Kentrum sp. MB TaxID=2138164 RepID=A0A450XVY0_9GAMM|nr:MAG: hypothetical protein BECKMB1821G_GA0114241_10432 [Candidatus Kentron sp. MB]VFK33397.1 MAG: hypothetical protein BECKMB1821I_GA0114274_10452 [Candidatus Kentron sp. MB]VFK76145.1 MAG: hypothetical protein BECKMB1821H_GA0114242_10442 [Candidatus Kentron sp. MB]
MFEKLKNRVKKVRGETRSLFTEEICPYCFDPFRLKDTPFRCASPPARCTLVPDAILERKWEDRRPVGKVLSSDGRFTTFRTCPDCGQRSYKRLCPLCHQELPHIFGEYRNYIFAVIGAKRAGKSHYLPALIEQIKHHVGPRMEMLLQPMNDFTINRYRTDFYNPLFNQHQTLEETFSALAGRPGAATIQLPMTFSLTFTGRNLIGKDSIKRAITLAFFDTAGEDLKSEDTMATVNKYIYRSHGIILLLDPLQLNRVRDQLGAKVSLPLQDTETSDIVSRVAKLIRQGRELGTGDKIPIPLAIALSKIDAVTSLLDTQAQINSSTKPGSGFDQADFEAIDAEVQSFVVRWDSEHLLQQVRAQFRTYGFFALSALGAPPDGTKVTRIVSLRVEAPFLWLLHHHKLI